MLQTFFVTPRKSIGWDSYWGIGPTFVFPTASEDGLGTDQYSAGPSIAVFRQKQGWAKGILVNHVWSYTGEDDAEDVSATLMEPTVSFTTDSGSSLRFNAEFRYDWERNQWNAPLQVGVGQLTIIRGHPVKFGIAYNRYILDEANSADWGVEFQITVPIKSPRWSIIR